MKVAIPTLELGGLDAPLNHHFGRTEIFTVVTLKDNEIKDVALVKSEGPHSCGGVVELIRNAGADVTIVGGIGGRPLMIMQQFGMKVFSGGSGTARDVLQSYLNNELQEVKDPHC